MKGILLFSLALLQPLRGSWGSLQASQPERTWCSPSRVCYNVYLRRVNYNRAQDACAVNGGTLSTASGRAEVEAILALLRGVANGPQGPALLWLGLMKKVQECTITELPLRGFSWASADRQPPKARNESTLSWVKEPTKTCLIQKCAGLQVTWGEPRLEPWGLSERPCNTKSHGYLCKYSYVGSCPAVVPHDLPNKARNLHYTLPVHLQSATLEFNPVGTMVTLRCPDQEMDFTCRLSPDGFHWEGTERSICSCPSGYWSPSRGDCVKPAECRGIGGAFLCLCAWDSRLGSDERSCVPPPGLGGEVAVNSTLAAPPVSRTFPSNFTGQNKSLEQAFTAVEVGNSSVEVRNISAPPAEKPATYAESSNYGFILITVAVVMLVILVMAALQGFQVCFKSCSSKGAQPCKNRAKAAARAEGDDPEVSATCTDSEHSLGPNKSAEASQDDLQPVTGQLEFEQP